MITIQEFGVLLISKIDTDMYNTIINSDEVILYPKDDSEINFIGAQCTNTIINLIQRFNYKIIVTRFRDTCAIRCIKDK